MSAVGGWTEKNCDGPCAADCRPGSFWISSVPRSRRNQYDHARVLSRRLSAFIFVVLLLLLFFLYSLLPPLKKKTPIHVLPAVFLWFLFVLLLSQEKWKGCYGITDRTRSWCGTSEPIIIRSSTRYKSDTMTKWASLPER